MIIMDVPVKDLLYSVWNPIDHKPVINTPIKEQALRIYNQHTDKENLELWKIVRTVDGWHEHSKIYG
jgi:hypothetical protein